MSMYNRQLMDDARHLLVNANRKNLMGKFDEAKELAQKAIDTLETEDCKDYYKELAWLYFFIGNNGKSIAYLEKDISASKRRRKEYTKTDEAYRYGSRFLDASISVDENELTELKSGWLTSRTAHHYRLGETAMLVAFDLDGTFLKMNGCSWDYLTKALNLESEAKKIEEEYRRGNLQYVQWANSVFALYQQKGLNKKHLEDLIRNISIAPGALETIQQLKEKGKKIALISGSLNYLVNAFFPEGTFDNIHINKVHFNSTGELSTWEATPYGDGRYKEAGLREICEPKKIISYKRNENWDRIHKEWKDHLDVFFGEWGPDDDGLTKIVTDYPGHQLHRTIYVGDNENDVEAAESAGMAIALNSKSKKLKDICEVSVTGDVTRILEYIG